jgi:hypothetical protein
MAIQFADLRLFVQVASSSACRLQHLWLPRKVENQCDPARTTPGTLEAGGEVGQREGCPTCPYQGAQVQVITVDARRYGFHAVAIAESAPCRNAPAELPRLADGLYHQNEQRTSREICQDNLR